MSINFERIPSPLKCRSVNSNIPDHIIFLLLLLHDMMKTNFPYGLSHFCNSIPDENNYPQNRLAFCKKQFQIVQNYKLCKNAGNFLYKVICIITMQTIILFIYIIPQKNVKSVVLLKTMRCITIKICKILPGYLREHFQHQPYQHYEH